jgi:uncharacterized protein DUF2530
VSKDPDDKVRDPDPFGGRPPIDHLDIGQRSYLVAPVPPLDVTGTRTVTIGVVMWALAFVALLPFYDTLREDGNVWWLWTCLAGFGLGLLGREYCRRREHRLRRRPHEPDSSPLGAAGL